MAAMPPIRTKSTPWWTSVCRAAPGSNSPTRCDSTGPSDPAGERHAVAEALVRRLPQVRLEEGFVVAPVDLAGLPGGDPRSSGRAATQAWRPRGRRHRARFAKSQPGSCVHAQPAAPATGRDGAGHRVVARLGSYHL